MIQQLVFYFLSDPINGRVVDSEYQEEYLAASNFFEVALINQEQLFEEQKIVTNRLSKKNELAVYRGWMLSVEQYSLFVDYIERTQGHVLTSVNEYCTTHLVPGWAKDSPEQLKIRWTEDLSSEGIQQLLQQFSGAVTIKDFVKSRKFEWDAFYIADTSKLSEAAVVIQNFIHRQGSNLVGGLVMREFIELKEIGKHPKSNTRLFEEYRIFYWRGQPLVVIDYWNNGVVNLTTADYQYIQTIGKEIHSSFFTIDVARKIDGQLIIMEMGDGQVSGLQEFDAVEFYHRLSEL